jgi:hypothetical protein
MRGHLNLDVIFIVPVLALLVVQRIRGDLSRPRFVAGLAVALLVQLGFSTEILATACVSGALTWVIFLAFAASEERRRLWAVAVEIILAAGIMAVLAAPFLYYVVKEAGDIPHQINHPETFSADLLNYLVPTVVTRLGSSIFGDIASRFSGNTSEQGAYLGLPLLLILLLQFRNTLRQPYLKPLLASLLVMLVLSLGPRLHVAGIATDLRLPWRLAIYLPLIHQALPTRFSMYVALATALATAVWLSVPKGGWDRNRRFTVAVLACLCLVPNRAMVARWTPLPLVAFFEPQNVVASLGHDANVILLPYGSGASMLWQWQSGLRFTQSGGYLGAPPESAWNWPAVTSLYMYTREGVPRHVAPSFEDDLSAFCVAHRVSGHLSRARHP